MALLSDIRLVGHDYYETFARVTHMTIVRTLLVACIR
jgi:hypothetical protein